jgi:hypothetical protein
MRAGESFDGVDAVVQNVDGKRWVVRVNAAPLLDGRGAVVGAISCFQDVTREHEMRLAFERQQRTFDLAMIASKMGTWRYTLADNICIYDENAQQLYGLTDARFHHEEEGVKANSTLRTLTSCGPVWPRRSIPRVTVDTTLSTE